MDENLQAEIIEIVFLLFLTSEDDKRPELSLDEVKEIFQERYNWPWDHGLERGFNIQIERYNEGHPGLLKLPDSGKYVWGCATPTETSEGPPTSIFFTPLNMVESYGILTTLMRNINTKNLLDDSRKVFERITEKDFGDELIMNVREYQEKKQKELSEFLKKLKEREHMGLLEDFPF